MQEIRGWTLRANVTRQTAAKRWCKPPNIAYWCSNDAVNQNDILWRFYYWETIVLLWEPVEFWDTANWYVALIVKWFEPVINLHPSYSFIRPRSCDLIRTKASFEAAVQRKGCSEFEARTAPPVSDVHHLQRVISSLCSRADMESRLSRLLVGLSVQIGRSDGELMQWSVLTFSFKATLSWAVCVFSRPSPSVNGEVRWRRQLHGDGWVAGEGPVPREGGQRKRTQKGCL